MAKKKSSRRKKAEPDSRGLTAAQMCKDAPPAVVAGLAEQVESDGGGVIGAYREPLGGLWQILVALPIDVVEPTPFQRDVSEAHVKRLTQRIGDVGRFVDPILVVRREAGKYWTPNGNHRLNAMRALGAKAITALLVPEMEIAYSILALNTEKAHNLREKALEVIRMARDLAALGGGAEKDHAAVFEDPELLTLGACYERNGRFAGGAYRPVLARVESFLGTKLPAALATREARAAKLFELDEAVSRAVADLKARGYESPYLKTFVVARVNPLRFQRGGDPDFDSTIDKMLAGTKRFDASKVEPEHIARSGGAPGEE